MKKYHITVLPNYKGYKDGVAEKVNIENYNRLCAIGYATATTFYRYEMSKIFDCQGRQDFCQTIRETAWLCILENWHLSIEQNLRLIRNIFNRAIYRLLKEFRFHRLKGWKRFHRSERLKTKEFWEKL